MLVSPVVAAVAAITGKITEENLTENELDENYKEEQYRKDMEEAYQNYIVTLYDAQLQQKKELGLL